MKNKKIIFLAVGLIFILGAFEIFVFLKNKNFINQEQSEKTEQNSQESSEDADIIEKRRLAMDSIEKNLFIEDLQTPFNDYWEKLLLEGSDDESLKGFYADYDKLSEYVFNQNLNQYQVENYIAIAETRSNDPAILKRGLERFAEIYDKKAQAEERNRAIALDRLGELNLIMSERQMKEFLFENKELLEREGSRLLDLTSTWEGDDFRSTSRNIFSKAEILNPFPSLLMESLYFDLENLLDKKGTQLTREDIEKLDLEKRLVVINGLVEKMGGESNVGPYLNQWCPDRLFYYSLYKARFNDILLSQDVVAEIDQKHLLSKEQTDDIYKKIFSWIEEYPYLKNKPQLYGDFARLYYAIFLNNNYGEVQATKIKSLLEPIYQMKGNDQKGIFVFLQKEAIYPDGYSHKREILSLAKVDSQMSDMLKEAGWNIE